MDYTEISVDPKFHRHLIGKGGARTVSISGDRSGAYGTFSDAFLHVIIGSGGLQSCDRTYK